MSAVWPQVADRLVALLPTLSGWSSVIVYDGSPDGADQGDYCAVGYAEDERGAGRWADTPSGDGYFDTETGEVRCELFTGNGDGDMNAARTAGFALVATLKSYIAANRDLAALPQGSTCSLAADVITGKNDGAGQLLVLSIAYTAPIT